MVAGRLPDKGRGINADKRFMPRKPDGWREVVPFRPLLAANDDFGWLRSSVVNEVGEGLRAFQSIAPALRWCVRRGLDTVRAGFFGKLRAQSLNIR